MANLPLAFAELLAGAVIVDAAIKGDSIANVVRGAATTHPISGLTGPTTSGAQATQAGVKSAVGSVIGSIPIPSFIPAGAKTLSGAASWFNHGAGEPGPGPADPGNSGQASGISFNVPGIAVLDNSTLRGYWLVEGSGKKFVVQQTDIGPATWTGRVVDFNYAARQAFLGGADPTGMHFKLTYLGKSRPK